MSLRQDPRSNFLRHSALALSMAAAFIACGGDDDASASSKAGSSGSHSGAGGHSGNSGGAGASGGNAAGVGSPSPTVICGGMACAPPPAGLKALAGALPIQGIPVPVSCCADDATCGTAPMDMGTCEPRAVADSRCKGVDPGALAAFAGGPIAGCCTADNACGVDGALFGRGCIENTEAAMELGAIPILGAMIAVPPPGPCDPNAAPSGNDAGI